MKRPALTIDIRGRRWKVRFGYLRTNLGECCEADHEITLGHQLHHQPLLDTAIHEVAHAACPDLSEDAVFGLAQSAAQLAYKLGFRDKP